MKTRFLLFCLLIVGSSCARYQIFNTHSNELPKTHEGLYVYEGKDLEIVYDFWSEAGVPAIRIVNLSSDTIFLAFDKSIFSVNNRQQPYYMFNPPRKGRFVPVVKVPQLALAPEENMEFEIYPVQYKWMKMPDKEVQLQFSENHSPLVIENKLQYTVGNKAAAKQLLQHRFWLSDVSQVNEETFKKLDQPHMANADKFFLIKDNRPFWREVLAETVAILPYLFY